jgi:hypothetical protein
MTSDAVIRQERENQETVARYAASLQPTFIGIPTRFYQGPLGWILAAVLLIWVIAK